MNRKWDNTEAAFESCNMDERTNEEILRDCIDKKDKTIQELATALKEVVYLHKEKMFLCRRLIIKYRELADKYLKR